MLSILLQAAIGSSRACSSTRAGRAAQPGYEIRRVALPLTRAAREGFERIEQCSRGGPAAHLVLRLRAALARPVHRAGISRLQRGLRGDAGKMGPVRRQDQSGRTQQRVSRDRSAGRALVPRLQLHGGGGRGGAELRGRRQRRGDGRTRELPRAHRALWRDHARRDAGKGALRARRNGAPSRRAGSGWADTTAMQVYTVHDIHPFFADEIVRRGAARSGITWHYNRPPVQDLEFEVDCRAVSHESVV